MAKISKHYDEASSGSESDDDSDDESVQGEIIDAGNATNLKEKDKIPSSDRNDINGDGDVDSGDSDSDSDSNSSDDSESKEEDLPPSNNNNDDDSDISDVDDNDSDNDEDLPLHERLRRQDNDFSRIRMSRERKAQALEVASERLAKFKQAQKKKNNKKRKAMVGDDDDDDNIETQQSNNSKTTNTTTNTTTTKKKKKSKHKPTEVSSKRADFFGRGAPRLNESGVGVDIGAHRYKPQDPRASNLSGHFDEDNFQHNYAFLEEMRNKEIGQVRKRISAHKTTGNKGNRLRRKLQINPGDGTQTSTLEDDEIRLKFLTETRADLDRRKIEREAKRSVSQKIRSDVESGKSGVYHLKRKERYRLELEAKLEVIQKRGGDRAVEKILEKKRQKNKTRDAARFAR